MSAGTLKKSHSLRAASTYEYSNKIVNFIASRAPNNQKFKLLLFGMNWQCCGLPVHNNTVIGSLSGQCTSHLCRNFARDMTFYLEVRKCVSSCFLLVFLPSLLNSVQRFSTVNGAR